jgi:hypothetical protein
LNLQRKDLLQIIPWTQALFYVVSALGSWFFFARSLLATSTNLLCLPQRRLLWHQHLRTWATRSSGLISSVKETLTAQECTV